MRDIDVALDYHEIRTVSGGVCIARYERGRDVGQVLPDRDLEGGPTLDEYAS